MAESPTTVMTCFRLPIEVRAAVDAYCTANNIGLSEFYRHLTHAALGGAPLGLTDGYTQARALATHLAFSAVRAALEGMPATLDEAIARFGLHPVPGT